ncbi:nitrogen regulation protein NR(II) [Caballeronia sp. LP006]|uniref:nitrogen regulation protein NR(II) n=1 Tax=unclassified Caballeronia TaxID=2646786 RepID=UPI001FD4440D|nr:MULTISPECIES: nitrogen regulation protein NR(II) [unclassified Caballeronia]MDR5801538.1 nitrogen regulation protein NR(II) [Caballeronia sp. LZ001]MDR5830866.1 nitrogen regulation protein NR(II) [Caballeronia sp. LP006]
MVLKNLIKARKGHADALSDDTQLAGTGLLPGLEALPTVVLVLDKRTQRIAYANPSAESMLEMSRKQLTQTHWPNLFANSEELATTIASIAENRFNATRLDAMLERPGREAFHVHAIVAYLEVATDYVLLELFENERHLRTDREERIHDLTAVNKQLIRNLAHEIKNPLGGIRGAAQLLEFELGARERDELREYTQVIIKESDRLQTLVDRLLEPHRHPHIVGDVNIHEVCERVRAVILAEFPRGLTIERDYDVSVPDLRGDKEQLIQALLNIVRNAAEALRERISQGDAKIELRTRIARKVTIGKKLHKLALDLHITDNGPGIPSEIRDRIFFPLVSGREDGSGLGLTLAQSFVHQHDGLIEVESKPGCTEFAMLLPFGN